MDYFTLYFDGGSRGNPGICGAGFVIDNSMNEEVIGKSIPIHLHQTNNYAEYIGLWEGLQEAERRGITHLIVKGDSLLVIRQMRNEYQVKSENIRPLFTACKKVEITFTKVLFEHIPRELNRRADQLANIAMNHKNG